MTLVLRDLWSTPFLWHGLQFCSLVFFHFARPQLLFFRCLSTGLLSQAVPIGVPLLDVSPKASET